jgi:predicted nucleotidyltransferase
VVGDRVTELVEKHRAALSDLCRRYGVERLYLFGSGASDQLEPSSDLDFLVEMTDRQPSGAYAHRYLDFAEELERLFARRVDLLTQQAVRNPYLLREIEATRELVYGEPRQEAAV